MSTQPPCLSSCMGLTYGHSLVRQPMRREVVIATVAGTIATAILAALVVVGSRRLSHFDAALVGYTFATLFAAFGITYRYAIWLQRPPTRMYWRSEEHTSELQSRE